MHILNYIVEMKKFYLLLVLLMLAIPVWSQTKVRGVVTDAESGEPLPFVNIVFKGTTVGTISDIDGTYFLQGNVQTDTLEFSYVGYLPYFHKVDRNAFQEVNVKMEADSYMLNEIVIHPGENPAWRIMRNVADNRKNNNPDKLDSYKYEVYNKMEIDLNNVKRDFGPNAVMKNFQFIFDYADTSAETGKVFLPIMITESLSDIYHKSSPQKKKEVIKASKISGTSNESLTQYTGQMYLDANIYKNYVPAFGHNFVSPVSDYWKTNYKYYLLDSMYQNGHYVYHLSFKPRHKQTYTFSGDMWVNDTTWAVTKIQAKMATDVNINYINNYIITQEYDKIDSVWFLTREEMFMDLNFTDSTMGFFGRKTMTRRNVEINPKFPDATFSAVATEETITEDGAMDRDPEYWNQQRHEQLSEKERNIYQMVDSIKEVPMFKNVTSTVEMLVTGYWVFKWWEMGPIYKFVSHNEIEGWRFRFGGRTSNEFSKKLMLSSYLAYGLKDKEFKYGAGLLYLTNKNPRRGFALDYKHDYEQLGQSINAFSEDNIMSTVLSRSKNDQLLFVDEVKLSYDHEHFPGFSNSLGARYRKLTPTEFIPFHNRFTDLNYKHLTSYELYLNTHFCFNEKFVSGEFTRISMGSDYPAFDLYAILGAWDDNGTLAKYSRITARVSESFSISPFGRFTYMAEAGKVLGKVPFPMLKLHEGNETYVYDPYAFNMMNLYEFASDTYVSATVEHHFNGFFLNKIPLMRKLKWREVVWGKGLWGNISKKNNADNTIMEFPESLGDVNKPYFEAGVGVENIFRFFRVDGIWRLTHRDNPDASKFAIMFKMQVIL